MNWLSRFRSRQAAVVMHSGGVIAYPTEAVWGLGCDPDNADAVAKVLQLKGRAEAKGVILIAAAVDQLQPYLGLLDSDQLARLSLPRDVPTTWVVPAGPHAPRWITGGRASLAVRITGHPLAAELCRVFGGPIVSTSANPQGSPPAKSSLRVRCYFPRDEVFIVPGQLGGAVKPSEIRDLLTGDVLRSGA